MRIIVVGGSLAGLFTANLLRSAGCKVDVFERSSSPLSGRGAGIVTHDGLLYALRAVGAEIDQGLGVEIHKRLAIGKAGEPLANRNFAQILTSWSRLLECLKSTLPDQYYHLGEEAIAVDAGCREKRAMVQFASGRTIQADLVIAADGLKSTLRRHLALPFSQVYAGYVAWRAVTKLADLSSDARGLMADTFLFSQLSGEQILSYPITAPEDAKQLLINLVWYRRCSDQELRNLLTDEDGLCHTEGIPPQKIRPEHLRSMRKDAEILFHGAWAEHLQKASSTILQPIFDSEAITMYHGRVAFVGDAAFVARPHVGQGVTKAAGDALCLSLWLQKAVTADITEALRQFSETRLPVGRMAVEQARKLGAPVVVSPLLRDGLQWETYYSQAENLIRDTAVELEGVVSMGDAVPPSRV